MDKATKTILDSFSVIVDTREQVTDCATMRYEQMGVPCERAVLDFGDYTYNLQLPGGLLHDTSGRITAKCVIERKQNLDELAMCFTRSRDRFQREFERAAAAGAKVYLLVENASLDMIMTGQYRSRFNKVAFLRSLFSWSEKYDMVPVFCDMGRSGHLIREILYQDAKGRLERGEYG